MSDGEDDFAIQIGRLAKLSSAVSDQIARLTPAQISVLRRPTFGAYARALSKSRRRLADRLPEGVIADPGLEILLELFASGEDDVKVSVSSCCYAAGVPPTTALRWIKLLEQQGMIERSDDVRDKRRKFLTLSSVARETIRAWLGEVSTVLPAQ